MTTLLVTSYLRHWLAFQADIDQLRLQQVTLIDGALEIPGVTRKTFLAIAKAAHETPGTIEEKLDSMATFIDLAFQVIPENEPESFDVTLERSQ